MEKYSYILFEKKKKASWGELSNHPRNVKELVGKITAAGSDEGWVKVKDGFGWGLHYFNFLTISKNQDSSSEL